jgi:hypothetical protein
VLINKSAVARDLEADLVIRDPIGPRWTRYKGLPLADPSKESGKTAPFRGRMAPFLTKPPQNASLFCIHAKFRKYF